MTASKVDDSKLPHYIQQLLEPGMYSHPVDRVELVQTHISFVILAGAYVYKWKKPVNFGFVDFSSLAKRKYFCEREVLLNRRLCPEIYLGTVCLNDDGHNLRLQGSGKIIEYGVKMARMPEEGMLGRVIAAGRLEKLHLDRIVDILVPFYRQADQSTEIGDNGRAGAVRVTVANNFAQTERFAGNGPLSVERFSRIKERTYGFLSREDLFNERMRAGCIRDCHGDLYSGNICLVEPSKIHIFDCLEFNDSLRHIDVCADVAFLAMDLDYHGLTALSDYFISRFAEKSGDQGLRKVLDFYKCYRAYVRGKVGLLSGADTAMREDAVRSWHSAAGRYFQLAEDYAGRLGG